MALLATLRLHDASYDYKVLDFHCHYSRHYNHFNPESAPSCERIEMTVVAPETDDYTLYEWYVNRSIMSGRLNYELPVTINQANADSRVIEFTDAQCFAISENYNIDSKNRRLLKIIINPGKVSMENVSFVHL